MRFFLTSLFFCFALISYAQMDRIAFNNPSFESEPRIGGSSLSEIEGWYDCGILNFPSETPPDIHSGRFGFWKVTLKPSHGDSYLGLVVRDNETWESLSQKLILIRQFIPTPPGEPTREDKPPLLSGNCYTMFMDVARSEKYISGSRLEYKTKGNRSKKFNYTTPAVIQIWGGRAYCNKQELLVTTQPVENSDWQKIKLDFTPEKDHEFITIEAFYDTPILNAYNGHVLIDNLSEIVQIECKD